MITYTRSAGHPLEHQIHGVRFICLCPGAVHTAMQVWVWPQFYKQLVFKAPLCIKLTISDQKIVSGSLFLAKIFIFSNLKKNCHFFSMQLFSVDATMHKFLAHENMKKPPQKVAYLSRNSVIFEIYSLPNSPRVHVPKCGL